MVTVSEPDDEHEPNAKLKDACPVGNVFALPCFVVLRTESTSTP